MNRLKFWLFALVVLALSAIGLRSLDTELRKIGVWAVDRQLNAALARTETSEKLLASELSAVAALAAQDQKLLAALRPAASLEAGKKKPAQPASAADPSQADGAVDQAAAEAVTSAQGMLGTGQPGHLVFATSREGLSRRAGLDPSAAAFLRGALDKKAQAGLTTLGGRVYAGAASPVGDDGALAVFAPLDSAWVVEAVAGTGATLIVVAPGQRPVAGARLSEVDAFATVAGRSSGIVDSGKLGPVDVSPPGLHLVLPPVHSFAGALPADRILVRPLEGVKGASLLLVGSTKVLFGPLVKAEWYGGALIAAALLLALLFGFLVKPTEVTSPVPQVLLDAARKIERGDFSARAPVLAGKVGTVADALNKAAEAAEGSAGQRAEAPATEPGGGLDPFATASRALRTKEAGASAEAPDAAPLGGSFAGAAFEAAPLSPPNPLEVPREPEPAPVPAPVAAPRPAPSATPAPVLAERAVQAVEPSEDEQHWRDVFRDFVRTRGECGESAEGLTYERFRQKLETNRSTLVAKYKCKTVRFQVYVKEGKAALKATPVR